MLNPTVFTKLHEADSFTIVPFSLRKVLSPLLDAIEVGTTGQREPASRKVVLSTMTLVLSDANPLLILPNNDTTKLENG